MFEASRRTIVRMNKILSSILLIKVKGKIKKAGKGGMQFPGDYQFILIVE
jgi:hypothetical protein